MTATTLLAPRSVPGTSRSVSPLGISLGATPARAPLARSSGPEQLRRLRSRGLTVIDLSDAREPHLAEQLVAQAFPKPDPDLFVIIGRGAPPVGARVGKTDPTESLRVSVGESCRRLHPQRVGALEVRGEPGVPESLDEMVRAAEPLATEGEVDAVAARTDPIELDSGSPRLAHPPLLSVNLSLLEPGTVRAVGRRSERTPTGVFVRDPFAQGRLDGTRASTALAERRPGAAPLDVRELRMEFAPVLRLGFLTSARRRTLAQAAVQYLLQMPWVTSVLVPDGRPERWDELFALADRPPLSSDELERVERITGNHRSREAGGASSK